MTVGLKGHVLNPAFPEGYSNWQKTDPHDLIDAELINEPTDKNVVKAVRKARQGSRRARDRDRLRPRGRADRPRGAARDPRRQPRAGPRGDQAAPSERARYSALTKDEIERAFAELDELSYDARPRRRRPPGHRPDLGRDADPRRLARDPPLRLQLPLGRPRAEPDPGPDRRARARAPRPRRQALLGAVRQVRAPRRQPSRPTTRPTSSGRRPRPTRPSPAPTSPGTVNELTARKNTRKPPTPYNTTAFTTDASSRLGITAAARDADRRGPLHGRVHLLPAHRQHRLPGRRCRCASWSPRWSGSPSSRPPRACSTAS